MTVPPASAGTLSRSEKQELLRKALVERAGRPRTAPASFAQERLWFLHRLQPESASYNLADAWRLSGALDAEALQRALGEVVRRHEALRTTFAEGDGAPVQVVAPFTGFTLPVEDLSALDEAEREATARRRASEDAGRPFDLAAGPLFRAALLRLGHEEHVLLLSMHHVVADGWSMGVLYRELAAVYAAYRTGADSPLPLPAMQYADYAARQRERLRGAVLERELAYWKDRLAGAPALLELPADHPRPAVQTHRGAMERIALPNALLARLKALARGEEATLFMVLLAAFQLLLAKYAGGDDVVVGSPVAGRREAGEEGLIGFFVNTLALRADLSGEPTFRRLLRRVRETTLDAYEHQDVPFEKVVEELAPERSLSHSPVVQVMFTLQEAPGGTGDWLPGVRTRRVGAEFATTKFDLTLGFGTDAGFGAALEYSTDLFERGTIRRMLGHLERVLEQVSADADVRLSELALLDDAERRLVVEEWNRTAAAYPSASIHQLFREQAARTPNAVAVVLGDESLTYRELDERSNRLAHHLARLGVEPETRVGLCLERGVEMVVSLLAILKAGGAYVPLDPGYPAERLALMLSDARVAVLLTQESLRGGLPATDAAVVSVDGQREEIAGESAEPPAIEAGPRTLAYVIYTSGSTGTPKGVAVEHRSVVRLVRGANYAELGPEQVILQAAPISFDASTVEIWGALLNGGRLVLIPGTNPSLEELGRTLVHHGVTTLWLTAGLFQVMVEERLDDLRGVRQLLAGGDVLPVEAVRKVRERFPGLRLINGYGPTENTTFTCCHTVGEGWSGGPVPIGRPISNTRVYVLDAALRPVPIGLPGELFAGGDGVARGYLQRPALTAERFIPDPFASNPGARLYRTGDRVRWRADGEVEYLGRLDAQAKIRGFRIEPGEVEAALRRSSGVAECAVVVREDAPGEKRLVAYVVGRADADGLRAQLRRSLPEYMLPAAFVALDHLPLDPNGKVDRAALPAPDLASDAEAYVAPRTPVEEVLAGIWAEVLKAERVGVHDSFFDLGGHSLLATRMVSRLREVFGIEMPLRAVFEAPTMAELAEGVESLRRAGLPEPPPIVPVGREAPLPLSFAQERLWFLDRMEPGRPLYNVPAALRLKGELDAAALERSLGEIVRRHEALRTVFREVNGSPVQVIAPFSGFTLPVEDLSGLDPAEREAEARRRVGDEAATPFSLAVGPLFRAALLRLAGEEHVLLLTLHHVVSDGWSLGVLFRELSALYTAYREGRESPLADLPVQYADFAAWQRAQLRGPALERELAWWKERLAGAPTLLELPTDRPRPATQSHRGAQAPVAIPAAVVERLRAVGRRDGATLYMVLLGAFQVLLARYGGSDDVVVGSPVAGRTRGEVEGMIGFFVNTLALRTDLSGDPTFREVLRRVRDATLGAYDHQEVPFEKLLAELQPERSLSHAPLFQVVLSLQPDDFAGGGLAGLRTEPADAGQESSKYDLVLTLAPHAGGLHGVATYATDLFEPATIRRMVAHLGRVLEQVAGDAELRLSRLELPDAEERRLVLEEWNRTGAAVPGGCVHQLFEAQAVRTPEAVAVVCGHESLTYRELDARANQLARHLRRLGVGPEARVGLCLERGVDLVASVLAVLKAGGAYVPLDPGSPAERLRLMLADSGVSVVLANGDAMPSPPPGVKLVPVDRMRRELAAEPAEPVASGVTPASLAYVIYTSGSTGTPKGVGIEHRGLSNYLAWFDRTVLGETGFALPMVSRVSFDAHVRQLFPPLLRGEAVWVLPEETAGDPKALLAALAAQGGRVSFGGVPSLWSAVLELVRSGSAPKPQGLAAVLLGGETLPDELAQRTFALFPEVALWNHYGPTEATVNTSVARLRPDQPVCIGRPVANARVYLLDAHGHPVPVGVPGEVHVGGMGVSRGYLGRPAQTAERFVPDGFSGVAGARMYRSGDRARWRAGGELEYVGRVDHQVKVRGFRIEPGEVEAALRRQAGVRECVVVAREDGPGERRLVAYVAGQADADALRAGVRNTLPDYMVPAAFVVLESLPRTPRGKVDRAALPAPEYGAGERHVAPRTPTEEVLAGIWADVLGLERVGVEENFFELGGHSLLATVVVGLVRQTFAVEMSLRTFFAGATVAELAAEVESLRRAGIPQLPSVAPVERAAPPPLSFAQERLWFLDRLQPGSAFYNVFATLRLEGPVHAPTLERALGEVVRRHEVLRTVFREVGNAPVQVITSFGGFALPVDDLSALPAAEREAESARRSGEEAARPFDLAAGPLFRARLLRLDAADHLLLLCLHHIVTDWWSTGVLFRELSALYAAYLEGRESPLPELPVQYADYAVWQREQLRGEALERQMAWWKERLAGAPAVLELPADRPRPPVQTHRGAYAPVRLSAALTDRLRALGQREGTTLYMVLLAAYQVLLGRYAATDDVVVGTSIAGRTRREVEGLIGCFANTLVLRTDLAGDPAFREVLRRVREVTLGAYDHQEVPFEKLVAELQPDRTLSHSPLFQAFFAWGNTEGVEAALPEVRTRAGGAAKDTARFDLTLGIADDPAGLSGYVEYSTDLFDRATIERMLGHLERVLEQVAGDAGLRLSRLELTTPAERARVLGEWSGAGASFPVAGTLHGGFAARAAQSPGAVAVSLGGERLTYGELDGRANRLAHRLVRLGVGPESRVGLCAGRSAELVVGVLAVLKAGGAYVPLDPEHPPERLAWIAEDAGVRVALAQEHLRGSVPGGIPVVALDDDPASAPAGDPGVAVDPGNLAYVIYTSGSTGRPKGVGVTHGNVLRLFAATDAWFGFGPLDVWTLFHSYAFDFSVWELWGALLHGGRLVVVPREVSRDASAFRSLLAGEGVTVLSQTPSAFRSLAHADERAADPLEALRLVVFGGEALAYESLRGWLDRYGPARPRLVNMYGITETTVHASYHAVTGAELRAAAVGSAVGVPIPDLRAYVLDRYGRPAPTGVPGELCVGGAGPARGYLGRPALTAERFVPDPFAGVPGARMYRSGDRARWRERERAPDPGGNGRAHAPTPPPAAALEYLGRGDQQVKVRGFRIEPGEVESALLAHPRVAAAAVVARRDGDDTALVAYVAGAQVADAADLRAHLRRSLPDYMVPGAFVFLDRLPLTPNGKLDPKALPAPDHAPAEERYAAPRTPLEETLAAIWAEVLRLERVGVFDDFFAIGGHSLLATRVVSRIREVLDGGLGVAALFETPTIDGLAGVLEERRSRGLAGPADGRMAGSAPSPQSLLAQIDDLPDEELDRLLGAHTGNGI